MATLGNPLVAFNQNDVRVDGDPGICCRLAYKWFACQAAPDKVKGAKFKFVAVNHDKTVDKQAAYLKEAEPYVKKNAEEYRLGVIALTEKFLNVWGKAHGLTFATLNGPTNCSDYFKAGNDKSSCILLEFGLLADGGNWAHATAYFAPGKKFFDPNKGEYDLDKVLDLGPALDTFHLHLLDPGEKFDRYAFILAKTA